MIEQVMKSNILHEASNLLKKQNKEEQNDKFNASFKDLLLTKDNENSKLSNDINTITITFEDNQDYSDENYNVSQTHDEYLEDNSYYNNKDKAKDITAKNENVESKNIHKEQINSNSKKSESVGDKIKTNDTLGNNDSLETIHIKLKYRNLDLKGDLDFRTKQKIKSILHDLKTGKINTNIANAFISQLVRNSHIDGLKSLNKNKKIKVDIKKAVQDNNIKNLVSDKKENNQKIDNPDLKAKNNKNETLNQLSASANKAKSKNDKLTSIGDKEQVKNDDVKLKDFKSEIKLDFNDKASDINFNKNMALNTKKALESNKQALFQQVVKNTKVVLAQNQTKFSTMIRPENLGRIDFQFIVKDGKMNGRLILQNQEVADFFKSNIEELRAVMQKSNVEMENIEIILAGNRFGEFANNQESNNFVNEENVAYTDKISTKNIEVFEENNSLERINYSKNDNSKINILI